MQLLGELWNILDHGIMIISKDGDVIDSNTAVLNILGMSYSEFREGYKNGRYQLFHKDGKLVTTESHSGVQAVTNNLATSGILKIVDTETNEEKWIDMRSQPLHDDTGHVIAGLCAIVDITDAVLFEQEKSDFISRASHELRTPVSIMDGFLNLAVQSGQMEDFDLYQAVCHAQRGSAMLRWLVVGMTILDGAKTDTSPITNVPISDVVLDVVADYEETAVIKKLFLETTVTPELTITGNHEQLKRMVAELLDNAIKFSEDGQVTIALTSSDSSIVLSVTDEGHGIPESDLPYIFNEGWQGDGSARRMVDGLGIGLSIVDIVTRRHNGRIEVSSRVGHGSTFTIRLPQ